MLFSDFSELRTALDTQCTATSGTVRSDPTVAAGLISDARVRGRLRLAMPLCMAIRGPMSILVPTDFKLPSARLIAQLLIQLHT